MDYLTVGSNIIYLHFETQIGNKGRPFRYVGLKRNESIPEKWVDKILKSHWIYTFIYIDTGELLEIEFDYNEKYVDRRN